MRRFVITGLLCLNVLFLAKAQNAHSLLDTVILEDVYSYGELQKFQSGAKIEKVPSVIFQFSQDGTLDQLLSRALPITLKSNAGGLSTIRVRGTSPNHTSLNFGGININSLTLGHSNFGNVPLYLFDEVGMQYGSSSSVNGSGSIGAAVHLGLKNYWTNGIKAETRITGGSFGERLAGAKIFLGNGRLEAVTRAYFYSKTNDFVFINPYYRDFEKQIFEIKDRQKNARIENMGLIQELNYRFGNNEFLFIRAWFENDWHEAQQNMSVNLSKPDYSETHEDKNIRIWAEYKNNMNPLKYQVGGGYVSDKSIFNSSQTDSIQSHRFIGETFVEHDLSKKSSYKVGVKAELIYPEVHAYSKGLKKEERIDFYLLWFYRFSPVLKVTANIRQGLVTIFKVPLTPSLGASYTVLTKENSVFGLSANISRSYRVPSFNDRFWIPGGNPDLKPEKGMNYELGAKWTYCNGNTTGNIKANLFYMNINDWILWKNGGSFWYADNVQNVVSKGLEFMADIQFRYLGFENSTGINYTFTSAQRVKSLVKTNALNRQLEYVPEHIATFFASATRKKLSFSIDGNLTGMQYTNEEKSDILDAYFLLNSGVNYQLFSAENHQIKIGVHVNNLLNTNYQSSYGYAMPGAAYRIAITYNYK